MKRREFLKAGSAAVATTGLAACGGGSTSDPTTIPDETPAGGITPADPAPLPKDPPPAGTPPATVTKTFYINDGLIPLVKSAVDANGESAVSMNVYFRGFSSGPDKLNVPGEALIIREGDTVEITVINTLETPHNFTIENIDRVGNSDVTVSIDIPGKVRGGADTSQMISFVAGSPGTYMYYDASNAPYNRLLGLHGALAVMPIKSDNQVYPNSPAFVKQQFWVFNDIDPIWNNAIGDGISTSMLAPFKPRYFTMNGLSGRPPRAPGYKDPAQNSMHDPRTMLKGKIGDRTLIRCINAGKLIHSMHIHANHMEWLPKAGDARQDVWEKDVVPLKANGEIENVIYPFAPPPDCVNTFDTASIKKEERNGVEISYPMHLHDEMTQTAAGGSYQFGAMTDIFYVSK